MASTSQLETTARLEELQRTCSSFIDGVRETAASSVFKEDSANTHGSDVFACMDQARKNLGTLDPAVPPVGLEACHFALWSEYCKLYA